MRNERPLFARDSERLVVFNTTSNKPLYKLLRFFLVSLLIAITVVIFMAPVLDKFFDWIDESIYHAIIVFGIVVVAIGSFLMYLKFKE